MGFKNHYGDIQIEVTVKRTELIERLKRARERHEKEFNQAIALWQEDLASAIAGLDVKKQLIFPEELDQLNDSCPVSYLGEYDDIIDMFEMGVKDEVLLDSSAFRKFCRDEWGWKSDILKNKYYRKVLAS